MTNGSANKPTRDKGPRRLSVIFALVSGSLSLAFIYFSSRYVSVRLHHGTPSLEPIVYMGFAWAVVFAVGLLIWGMQKLLKVEWIGHPTLEMVAGVSGSIIAVVTFLLLFVTEAAK